MRWMPTYVKVILAFIIIGILGVAGFKIFKYLKGKFAEAETK